MRFRAPGEQEAQERAWAVVRRAYEEREPVAWPRRHVRPLAAAALVAVVAAAALSPPGRSVVHSLRKAVGVEQAEPALFSLPTHGDLLVTSRKGLWLVHRDGSKRLLGTSRTQTSCGAGWTRARYNTLYRRRPRAALCRGESGPLPEPC